MKRNIRLAFLILLFFSLQKLMAQTIPNASFEDWSGGQPVGWYVGDTGFIVKSNNAHTGNYAAQLVVKNVEGFYASTPLVTGNANSADYATTGRPDSLYFWYILNSPERESFEVISDGINSGAGLRATGIFQDSITTLVYKQGAFGYNYNSQTGNLDTIAITINIVARSILQYDSGDAPGTYLIVDDLSFTGVTGVNNLQGNGQIDIVSVQPNPSSDRTAIIYNMPVSAEVTLEVYDLAGRKVSTLVNTKQTPGTYKAILQTSGLPSGNYLCKLNADGLIATEKIVVIK